VGCAGIEPAANGLKGQNKRKAGGNITTRFSFYIYILLNET